MLTVGEDTLRQLAAQHEKQVPSLAVVWRRESSETVAPIAWRLLALRNIVGGNRPIRCTAHRRQTKLRDG